MSAADGSVRVLKSFGPQRSPNNLSFSPDGRFIAYDVPPAEDGPARDVVVAAVDGSREVPVVSHAANDELLGWFADGQRLLLTSDRTGTNDVYALVILDGRAQGEPRILKRDVGAVTAAMGFTRSGEFVFGTRPDSADVQLATLDAAGRLTDTRSHWREASRGTASRQRGRPTDSISCTCHRCRYQQNQKHFSSTRPEQAQVRTIPVAMRWFHNAVSWDADGRHVLLQGPDMKEPLRSATRRHRLRSRGVDS